MITKRDLRITFLLAVTTILATPAFSSDAIYKFQYTNCDYGYFVTLKKNVVAHGTMPPSPNHGFMISISKIDQETDTLTDSDRVIWVDASYNASDASTLKEIVDEQIKDHQNKDEKQTVTTTRLAGFKAMHVQTLAKDFIEERIMSYKGGILYTLTLKTNKENLVGDSERFREVVGGFKFRPIPKQCVVEENDPDVERVIRIIKCDPAEFPKTKKQKTEIQAFESKFISQKAKKFPSKTCEKSDGIKLSKAIEIFGHSVETLDCFNEGLISIHFDEKASDLAKTVASSLNRKLEPPPKGIDDYNMYGPEFSVEGEKYPLAPNAIVRANAKGGSDYICIHEDMGPRAAGE